MNILKKHLRNNGGDMYIEMLICFIAFIIAIVFIFQACSSMSRKMWIDDKINDITKIIAVEGNVKDERITQIEAEIDKKMGKKGTFSYTCEDAQDWYDEAEGKVQLNGRVVVRYVNNEYPVISVGQYINVKINVNLERVAISEKYYKPE